jgi:argininosuccinate lyase
MKLWEKGASANKLIDEFTAGRDREIDLLLAPFDVIGSIAHARMLQAIGLITGQELGELEYELKRLYETIERGEFRIDDSTEDVHSQVEIMLTSALGETGKKIHTARSRNDQVLLDMKLFARQRIKEIVGQTVLLFEALVSLSDKYSDILMPGYTHMQVAMPSSFGLWFGAYAENLAEDMILLHAAYRLTDQNPLGSAAGYGSSFNIDRQLTTELLGFENMHVNVVNAQMNRGKMEKTVAMALGSVASTLSRMAMDICLYSGQNFGFIRLPDEFTTGSSIMPHKKNPDVFELIRARGNKLQALQCEISLITANLPSGYHRDFQQIKESFLPSFDMLLEMLSVTAMIIDRLVINPDITGDDIYSDLFSVEEVNKLVSRGISFREAYRMVAGKIADGTYEAGRELHHVHTGSIGNLCNDLIREKMQREISGFDFQRAEDAIGQLLGRA